MLDKIRHSFDICINPPELLTLGITNRAAIAGTNRVNHDQVGAVQDTELIGNTFERRAGEPGIFRGHDNRAKYTHMQPDRRGPRTAVIGEHDRAIGEICDALFQISGITKGSKGVTIIIFENGGARYCFIADRVSINSDLV